MSRPKSQPDEAVFAQILLALTEHGTKAVTFGLISKRCGLAPASLSQRFGSVVGMTRAAVLWEWARLCDAVTAAEAEALVSSKGAQALLKTLPNPSPEVLALSLVDPELAQAAASWRALVESAVAARRGGGIKGREAAALIFAAWQGRQIWDGAGGKGFRLSDLLKALT